MPTAVDEDAGTECPRWVGNEFIYFLDIPCIDINKSPASSSPCRHVPNKTDSAEASSGSRSYTCIADLTRIFIEGITNKEVSTNDLMSQEGTSVSSKTHTKRLPWAHGPNTSGAVITSNNLARLLIPWACESQQRSLTPDPEHSQQGQKAKSILMKELRAFDDVIAKHLDNDLLVAFTVFLDSLCRCVKTVWGGAGFDPLHGTLFMSRFWSTIGPWFNSSVTIMDAGLPFAMYAVSRRQSGGIDFMWTEVANTTPGPNHIPHVTSRCTCLLVKPPLDDLRKALSSNVVPAVIFDGRGLSVRPATQGPYVAISHVWADGLGSSAEKGLPRCQVERIDALIRHKLGFKDGAFWHDGLCVPSPAMDESDWQRAIALLRDTYAGADRVLVIDRGIQTQCSRIMPKEECLVGIGASRWMRRIWTLQEGVLARELYFEVADGVINCSHFDGEVSKLACHVIPPFQNRLHGTRYQPYLAERPRYNLNTLIPLMKSRTTSYPEDEPLAIAGLLGIDAEKLAHTHDGETRMKILLLEVRTISHNILLYGWAVEKRLSIPNFTWAPPSLSQILWPTSPKDVAICTEEGLIGEFTIVQFPNARPSGGIFGVATTVTDSTCETPLNGAETEDKHIPAINADDSHFFKLGASYVVDRKLTFNACLVNRTIQAMELRAEYPVALVRILSDSPLQGVRCKYVGPGQLFWLEAGHMPPRLVNATIRNCVVNVV